MSVCGHNSDELDLFGELTSALARSLSVFPCAQESAIRLLLKLSIRCGVALLERLPLLLLLL